MIKIVAIGTVTLCALVFSVSKADDEITPEARKSIEKGINWIKANQDKSGYWG